MWFAGTDAKIEFNDEPPVKPRLGRMKQVTVTLAIESLTEATQRAAVEFHRFGDALRAVDHREKYWSGTAHERHLAWRKLRAQGVMLPNPARRRAVAAEGIKQGQAVSVAGGWARGIAPQ